MANAISFFCVLTSNICLLIGYGAQHKIAQYHFAYQA